MNLKYHPPKFNVQNVKMWDDMVSVSASSSNDIWGTSIAGNANPIPCEGFYVDTAGSFTFVTAKGNTKTVALVAGYHPGRIVQVTSGSGIWVFPP